jgi:hypothetical protein
MPLTLGAEGFFIFQEMTRESADPDLLSNGPLSRQEWSSRL